VATYFDQYWGWSSGPCYTGCFNRYGHYCKGWLPRSPCLTLNIPSLSRQRCLPSWGPRRTPWVFCNFSTVWCGRLLKLCLGFWNYNLVINVLLAFQFWRISLCNKFAIRFAQDIFQVTHITHPTSEHCYLLSIVGGPFFSNLQVSEPWNNENNNIL
jgi:hypothetical protein